MLLPAAEFERLADEFLASDHVVELLPEALPPTSRLARQPIFTTPEILGVQQRILDRYREGADQGVAIVPEETLSPALLAAGNLTAEQGHLVRQFCASGNRVQCAIGRAGAGKTTTMRAAAAAWETEGFRVVGCAVKGEAARHLAEGTGIPTETVAWFLARREAPVAPLDSRSVLIVDEASTLSDRDLDALLSLAERTGAAVRLIGDPAQHGAVAAGGMFRYLSESHPTETPELRTTHRMTDPADRAAAEALRDGRIADALDHLAQAGHLHVVDDDLSLYVGMLRRWWDARSEGQPHPMVDRRHRTRHQLNRLARRLLAADGQLGDDEIEATGGRGFAVGDEVVARMAARHLHPPGEPTAYVRNGASGAVVAVVRGVVPAGDRLRIVFKGAGTIDVPRGFFDEHEGPGGRTDVGIDHAYAVTSYSVQGATYGSSTSRIDEGASRSEAYVDITRGRGANHLFVTQAADPLNGEHLPKAPPPALVESVGARLQASGPERAALEVDPGAARPSDDDRVAEMAGRRAYRVAAHDVPVGILGRFPLPAGQPVHVVRHRVTAFQAVAGYHARWHPQQGGGPWEWGVGRPVPVEGALGHRRAVITALAREAVVHAAEELRPHGWDGLPPWAASHITLVAASGVHPPDWPALGDLYGRVARYRDSVGASDDTDEPEYPLASVLGPVPPDLAAAAVRQSLAIELESASRPLRSPTLSRS